MNAARDFAPPALLLAVLAVLAVLAAACAGVPTGAAAGPVGVALSWTLDSCRAAASRDRDADGVDDDCELALAQAFAPELIVDPRDCSWDATASQPRLGGGYLFAVQGSPSDRRAVRVAYLPAYFHDCGWVGAPCALRGAGCSAHAGDSEIIVVEARYDVASHRWSAGAVFLSAHCFGRTAGRCRWYRGGALRYFAWSGGTPRGAPRVWVARGKHANYPTRRECDSGHWYQDSCDGNGAVYRFPVGSNAYNIGSRAHPLPADGQAPAGCITAERLPSFASGVDAGTHECFWDPGRPFRGWQRELLGEAPSAYARVLRFAAGF